ncbi:MAG: hypothetical protein KIT31_42570, partial [Deltaproteobacteria bacterium]|nr:hypothetical protein [Deltaproteobacteria bacterium]
MTTGAPIYLVSACSSGEEFVAAFRRYADRNGLFIPMADPIPVGKKGHFALTLADGGVMVSGEAEIISSAKTPSVLHGRVGMTLRFADLDAESKTVLVELEKARLSMRPPPPSVPPRPAVIPAEPRPQPPTLGGRIDAMNALAECVAIGDVDAMPVVEKLPPKAGPKFVVPTIPVGGGMPARTKSASTPPPAAAAPPADKGAASERTGARAPIPSTIPPPLRAPVPVPADTAPDGPPPAFRAADTNPDAPPKAFRAADTTVDTPPPRGPDT